MSIQDEIPQSRLTLRYETEVNGQLADITLPLRLLITGDFSQGTSTDSKIDFDERRVRNMDGTNTDAVMKDMGMSLNFQVENHIDAQRGGDDMAISLPIDSIKSFAPDHVVDFIPKLKGLVTLKTLITEMLNNVDNRRDLHKLMDELLSKPENLGNVLADLKGFESFKIPSTSESSVTPESPAN